jgi:hypothetical protein
MASESFTMISLLVFLAGLAGYYAGRFEGYRQGQQYILAMVNAMGELAEAQARREAEPAEHERVQAWSRQGAERTE